MTIRSAALRTSAIADTPSTSARQQLAALPSGSVVAIFDTRVDAANAALQASVHEADAVWLARGSVAAEAIREARARRGRASKVIAGLSDEEQFVQLVIKQADAGRSLVVSRGVPAEVMARCGGVREVVSFGRWTVKALL